MTNTSIPWVKTTLVTAYAPNDPLKVEMTVNSKASQDDEMNSLATSSKHNLILSKIRAGIKMHTNVSVSRNMTVAWQHNYCESMDRQKYRHMKRYKQQRTYS